MQVDGSGFLTGNCKMQTVNLLLDGNIMKSYIRIYSILFFLFVLTMSPTNRVCAETGEMKKSGIDDTVKRSEKEKSVSINFNDVDIRVFIKFISELTGKNFVVDQKVKGKVTIISPEKISIKEAFKVFESVLEVHGYASVRAGEIYKVIPLRNARSKNIETKLKKEADATEDKIVTQLIPLRYADSLEIKKLFAPMVPKSSSILAYSPSNILIITDLYSNIKRLLKILSAIDVTGMGRELSVIPLEYADSVKLEKILTSVFKTDNKKKKAVSTSKIKFMAYERTNVLVVLATEDEAVRIKELIRILDRETPVGKEKVRVFFLENAVAEDMAKVLQELSKKVGSPKDKDMPVISDEVKITPDKATNSLIIMAGNDEYKIIEDVIKQLDIPRSMVYIEALIVEVNVDKDFRLGTEWMAGGKTRYDNDKTAAFGGGFTSKEKWGGPSVTEEDNLVLTSGFSMGIFGETIEIGGIAFPNISSIIQAYKKDKDVSILSTPQILTTDNEEAKINVGKNIPFQTRTSTSDNDTYNSFEYRDVGKTLIITPHISQDRMVRLKLSLEVTSCVSEFPQNDSRPTTLKRTIDTSVIVKDKKTVVLGGLIDDTASITEYKVPCIGDIPVLGWAFKSRAKNNDRTNLFVFLTPHVVQNASEAKEIYNKKQGHIDKIKEGKIKMYQDRVKSRLENVPEQADKIEKKPDTAKDNKTD